MCEISGDPIIVEHRRPKAGVTEIGSVNQTDLFESSTFDPGKSGSFALDFSFGAAGRDLFVLRTPSVTSTVPTLSACPIGPVPKTGGL